MIYFLTDFSESSIKFVVEHFGRLRALSDLSSNYYYMSLQLSKVYLIHYFKFC